jgi:hypothetical protein
VAASFQAAKPSARPTVLRALSSASFVIARLRSRPELGTVARSPRRALTAAVERHGVDGAWTTTW